MTASNAAAPQQFLSRGPSSPQDAETHNASSGTALAVPIRASHRAPEAHTQEITSRL